MRIGVAKKSALKLAGGVSASFLLFSSGEVWAQCSTAPPAALAVTGSCSESGAVRSTNTTDGHVVHVLAGGEYRADGMTITSGGRTSYGVTMDGPQSTLDLKNSTVTTHGLHSYAVRAGSGSTVDLENVGIVTHGAQYGYGLIAEAGSVVSIKNLDVVTEGHASDALIASGEGTIIRFDQASLITSGESATGITVLSGAVVEGANATVRTQSPSADHLASPGVYASGGSKISLVDSTISVDGFISAAVHVKDGSEFYGNRLDINTSGVDVWGVTLGDQGTKLTLIESTVTTTGAADSRGLVVKNDAVMVLDRVDVATAGANAQGIHARAGAEVDGRNVTVETLGSGASGVSIGNGDTLVAMDGGSVRTSGSSAHAFHVEDGGTLTATNVHVGAVGEGSSAVALSRPESGDVADITFNGGSLASVAGPLIVVDGGHGTITINGPTDLSPGLVDGRRVLAGVNGSGAEHADISFQFNGVPGITGDLITTGSSNDVSAALTSSDWVGDLQVAANNTVRIGLADSMWSGQSTGAAAIDLDAASAWNITGSSSSGAVANAGRVGFISNESGFSTLTVRDYSGQDGILEINAVLESDNSPSNRLVVDGGVADGKTSVVVTNVGGSGALTTGDGIPVVETLNGGSTMGDAFHLAERTVAGAYEYRLFRGGSVRAEDWFLRSHLIEQQQDAEVVVPLYRPEVPLYTPAPAMARQMGLSLLGTLHERVGEQMNVRPHADQRDHLNGAWGRVIGESGNSKWSGTAKARARDANIVGVQAGLDVYRAEQDNGYRNHAGLYGGHIRHSAKVRGLALGVDNLQVGKLTLDGPAVGAYWTRYSPAGTYLDGVVQWNRFDVDAKANYGSRMDTKGTGFVASLETGHPVAIGNGWQVEPQAQLIYQSINMRGTSDALSTVTWREGDAVTGRLGARFQFTSEDGDTLWQPYAKANVWHGFGGKDRTVFGANAIETRFGDTALELGAGATAKVSEAVSVYAHLDHRWSVSGRDRHSFTGGAVGVRINW